MFDGRESEDERETGRAPGGAPSNQTDFTLVEFNLDFQEKKISPRPGRRRGRAAGIQDFLNIQRSEAR
jgi:hypothetical protein